MADEEGTKDEKEEEGEGDGEEDDGEKEKEIEKPKKKKKKKKKKKRQAKNKSIKTVREEAIEVAQFLLNRRAIWPVAPKVGGADKKRRNPKSRPTSPPPLATNNNNNDGNNNNSNNYNGGGITRASFSVAISSNTADNDVNPLLHHPLPKDSTPLFKDDGETLYRFVVRLSPLSLFSPIAPLLSLVSARSHPVLYCCSDAQASKANTSSCCRQLAWCKRSKTIPSFDSSRGPQPRVKAMRWWPNGVFRRIILSTGSTRTCRWNRAKRAFV